MKAMLHGLPMPFITIDGHYEVGEVFTWDAGLKNNPKFKVIKCDPIGDKSENQLQNVYLEEVGVSK